MSGRRRSRAVAAVFAGLLASSVLAGCTLGPNPNDIVYPTDIPTADTTKAPRSSVTAQPVDPAIGQFCSDIAVPIVQLQSAIEALTLGSGGVEEVAPRATAAQQAITPYGTSRNSQIARWVPAGVAYLQSVQAAASSPAPEDQLRSVVGQADVDGTFDNLLMICAGQPGWE